MDPGDPQPWIGLRRLRSRASLTYLVVFVLMMGASALMYTTLQSGSQPGTFVLVILVVLANLLSLIL